MIPRAEPARDAAELQRCPQERAPQRSAALVIEARHSIAPRGVLEVERVLGATRHVDPRGQDPAEAPLPLRRLEALEQHGEAVARADVAGEVHFPVVHVGDRPRELASLGRGQEGIGHRLVERVVQRGLDRARHPQPCNDPGNRLDRLDPARPALSTNDGEAPLGRQAYRHAARDAVGLQTAEVELEPGPEAAHRQALRRGKEGRVVAPSDAAARQHVGDGLTPA